MTDYLTIREPEGIRHVFKKLLEEPITGGKLSPLGVIENSLKGIIPVDIIIDSWPNISTMIVKYDSRKHGLYGAFYEIRMYSTNTESLEGLLASPGVIPWELPIEFAGIPDNCIPIVEKAIKNHSKGGALVEKDECYVLDHSNVNIKPRQLPSGFRIRRLTPSDAAFVNKAWTYGGHKEREKYIEFLIKTLGGVCVVNANDEIVGISGKDIDGSFAMGWTHPDYRRRGLMEVLFPVVNSEAIKQKSNFEFGHVIKDNHASIKASQKINSKIMEETVAWLLYQPPGQRVNHPQSDVFCCIVELEHYSKFLDFGYTIILSDLEPEARRAVFQKLRQDLNDGNKFLVLGLLENSLKGIVPIEVLIDQWPNFTTVILKYDLKKTGILSEPFTVTMYSTNTEVLYQMLTSPGAIPWNIKLFFKEVPDNCVPVLRRVMETAGKGGKITNHGECRVIDFRHMDPPKRELPKGFKIRLLTPEDAEFVNSTWPHSYGKKNVPFIKYLLSTQDSYCVENDKGEIIVVNCKKIDGSYGLSWTRPDFRRSGLFWNIMYHEVTESKRQKNVLDFGYTRTDNPHTPKFFKRVNGKLMSNTAWYFIYEPKTIASSKL